MPSLSSTRLETKRSPLSRIWSRVSMTSVVTLFALPFTTTAMRPLVVGGALGRSWVSSAPGAPSLGPSSFPGEGRGSPAPGGGVLLELGAGSLIGETDVAQADRPQGPDNVLPTE